MAETQFSFEDWLVEGMKGMRSRLETTRIMPEAFWEHLRNATRESLLAFRSLIDAAIERTEKKQEKKATKIKVE